MSRTGRPAATMAASGPRTSDADQGRAGRPAGRAGSRPKMPGPSTKLGAAATGQSSWRASVVFDHHWAIPVREHQLGGHSACAGLGRPTGHLRHQDRHPALRQAGRRRPWGAAATRVLVVGWIATKFFVVNISARSAMVTHLSAWVVLTGPHEGSHPSLAGERPLRWRCLHLDVMPRVGKVDPPPPDGSSSSAPPLS